MKDKIYKLNSKKSWVSSLSVLLGALVPMRAMAIPGVDSFVEFLVGGIWTIFGGIAVFLLQLELFFLRTISSYNNFSREPGVIIGWTAVRDLSNMFFILILLVIAFATILNIKSYGYQQLLSKTIIIAILINFSKTIVGFAIDISQVIMLTFVRAVNDVITGGIAVALGIQGLGQAPTDGGGIGNYIVAVFGGIIMLFIAIVVIAVLVMMLTMRIIALWIAIVLAPLAFVANIFPNTRGFYQNWVKELGRNLATGPMLAFFLWLTFAITASGTAYQSFDLQGGYEEPTQFLSTTNMVNFIVAITLLLMGMKMAAQSGAAGASFAAKGLKAVQNTASKAARRYPLAAASRMGALAARGIVRGDGSARSLGAGIRGLGNKLNAGAYRVAGSKVGQKMGLDNQILKASDSAARLRAKAGDRVESLRAGWKDRQASLKEGDSFWKKAGGQAMQVAAGTAGKTVGAAQSVKWNRVPVFGGRLQRGAMQMMGYDAARTARFKAEDEKYILPQHRVAFEESQATMTGNKLQTAWSYASSLGGNRDRDAMLAQNLLARGEINVENADWATDQLRRIGDEEGMQKIQSEYWTFNTKNMAEGMKEALRIIEKKGLGGLLSSVKTDNLYTYEKNADGTDKLDANGEKIKVVKKNALIGLEALADPSHGNADHNAIASYILKWNKGDRGTMMAEILPKIFDFKKHFAEESALATKNGYEQDKRGILDVRLSNPASIWSQVQAKIYPQEMGDKFDEEGRLVRLGIDRYFQARARKDVDESFVRPGQVGSRLQMWHGESKKQFKKRQKFATALDRVHKNTTEEQLPEEFRGRFQDSSGNFDFNKFKDYRQKMYRQILGLDAFTENMDGSQRTDFHNNDHIFNDPNLTPEQKARYYAMKWVMPESARTDIMFQDKTLAKETADGYKARKAMFATTENPEEYEARFNAVLEKLMQVQRIQMTGPYQDFDKNFGEGAFERIKQRMMAEIVGDKRTAHGLLSKSFWTEAQDGAHGSRLAEVNVGNDHEAVMLDHALDSSENQQQSQAFQVSTAEQTQYIVNKLAELGKQPQKVLMENIPNEVASAAMQKLRDVKALQEGVLPQDFSILGADIRKLTSVLQYNALKAGFSTVQQYLDSDGQEALKKFIEGLKKVHKNNPDVNFEFNRNYGYEVQDGGYGYDKDGYYESV